MVVSSTLRKLLMPILHWVTPLWPSPTLRQGVLIVWLQNMDEGTMEGMLPSVRLTVPLSRLTALRLGLHTPNFTGVCTLAESTIRCVLTGRSPGVDASLGRRAMPITRR